MLAPDNKSPLPDEAAVVDEAITSRRSVRAFLPDAVDESTIREILQVAVVTAGLLGAHWLLRHTTMEAVVARLPRPLLAGVWTLMLCGIMLTQGNGNAFIYFQF